MKFVLFCQNPYAFGIMEPIMKVLKEKGHDYLWFLTDNLKNKFPYPEEPSTNSIEELKGFQSDVIFCPGNEVPHFLRGLKVQIFHGLAGEKKGHFRIRHYFDLYLTQGPYFTRRFNELKAKHKDFEVIETGWPKLDIYGKDQDKYSEEKRSLLKKHTAEKIILYAPTFSPSLTSAPFLGEEIKRLALNKNFLVIIKFHDLMDPEVIKNYKALASYNNNLIVEEEPNNIKVLLMADLMVSDTSSVVYEFLLLDKPVITFNSSAENILWENSQTYDKLSEKVAANLDLDPFAELRSRIIQEYHPYNDGNSAVRMVEAAENYITRHGVPEKRKLPFLRKLKMKRMFK